MDLERMNKHSRLEYNYVRECMAGLYDISVHSKRARRNRRLLTNILDKWLKQGHIEDYRLSKGLPVEDAFGVHGHGVRLMIEIFTGYEQPQREHREIVDCIEELAELPPPQDRPLDHSFQGKRHPFAYTLIQREIEDEIEFRKWHAEQYGIPFKLSKPIPVRKPAPTKRLKELLKKERLF